MNNEHIKQAVLKHFDKDGVHQSLLELGYSQWQKEGHDWSYSDMITWVTKTYGTLVAFAILVGKYNQQVCNGGHVQYFDNGYGGGTPGNPDFEIPLHQQLVRYMAEFGFAEHPVNAIMVALEFDVVPEDEYEIYDCCTCGGDGDAVFDCEACDTTGDDCNECEGAGKLSETCEECGGDGEIEECIANRGDICNEGELNALDDRYYRVCDAWMVELEAFFRTHLNIDDAEIVRAV